MSANGRVACGMARASARTREVTHDKPRDDFDYLNQLHGNSDNYYRFRALDTEMLLFQMLARKCCGGLQVPSTLENFRMAHFMGKDGDDSIISSKAHEFHSS